MFGGTKRKRALFSQCITTLILVVLIVNYFEPLASIFVPYKAEAAEVILDNAASAAGTSHLQSGSQTVFVDDTTGYKFYRDTTGICVYVKTLDSGATWGSTTTVDAQTDCVEVQVWYDKWTPGLNASSSIHIATLDTSADDIFYNRLDTTNDTLLLGSTPVSMVSNTAQGGSITQGENHISITRGTDGTIYAVSNDGSGSNDSYIVECTISCQTATRWTETGTNPLSVASDANILMPLAGGNILLINRNIAAEDMRSKIWNNTAWSAAWTTFDLNATDNTTYDVGMAAAVSSTTPSTVYVAYIANNATLGTDDEVRTAIYNGTTWATSTAVITGTTRGLTNVALALDGANDDVYVAYAGRTTAGSAPTGNVYWKTATSSMKNWSAEYGPVNTTADDVYGVDLNLVSDQRLYLSWFEVGAGDVLGNTIADIYPGVHATSSGSQISIVYASTSAFYTGGSFVIYDTYNNHNITGITLTEDGTIDAANDLKNIELFYETDTQYPYDCAGETYAGTESPFGSTVTGGFSGADGTATFSGMSVNVSSTTALCVYPVMSVLDSAASSSTINVFIANPQTDVAVSGWTVQSTAIVDITGSTTVLNDIPTQSGFHFRNDDGTEVTATSRTGGTENTPLAALTQGSSTRLRIGVANLGSSSTPAIRYRIEYAATPGACSAASSWTDVGVLGGAFDMYDSTNLTEGSDTTNIAVASGGVSDGNPEFITPNGGVKDTSSETSGVVATTTQFIELEYSIMASTSAPEGTRYCFRVTDAGYPLYTYTQYPSLTVNFDTTVATVTAAQVTATSVPATNFYVGSAFSIKENQSSRNVTSISIEETGTVDAQSSIRNVLLQYDLDTTAPYDCEGETYGGGEPQYGSTDTDGFSAPNGTSTFTGSVAISTTQALCIYPVLDILDNASNTQTLNLVMQKPSEDVVTSGGGTVGPRTALDLVGSTTLNGPLLKQIHYHWRSDNGDEAGATSLTMGLEDTPVTNVSIPTPVRLRLEISNKGAATSSPRSLRLEYGTKITTCSAVAAWTDVGAVGGDWDMYNSPSITDGNDTTNIAVASGGVTDDNPTFKTPNSALKDTGSTLVQTTIGDTRFLEAEFAMKQTTNAAYSTTYCFRVASSTVPLDTYSVYPELTTSPERDFEIQRGTVTISGSSVTLTAGVDYIAPQASTSAFIRITNAHYTGAGSAAGGVQDADDVTAYIVNPSNILNSVTIERPSTATGNTRVSWEIIEFTGEANADNEIIVRSQTTATYGGASLTTTGATVPGVVSGARVVVFVTGQLNPSTATTSYNTGQSTSAWSDGSTAPMFTRGESGTASMVSYAVVEFTGANWNIQRIEHQYTATNTTETEPITAVNSLARTFVYAQKRSGTGLNGVDEFGHEVWLSSVGFVSFVLQQDADMPSAQTSVAWIIENTQTSVGAMDVTRSNGASSDITAPLTLSIGIGKTLTDLTNASIFVNTRAASSATAFPAPLAGVTIASTTNYELWRGYTAVPITYRTEIVEWPTAGLALKQNYYRFYADNDALIPTDPWPLGASDLGENTISTAYDDPPASGDHLRIRMSIKAVNSNWPASSRTFKLQYGALTTTCSAISEANWATLGSSASTTLWRGYDAGGTTDGTALSIDPPTGGDLKISVSDVAGTLEEQNDSVPNPFAVPESNDAEYDWYIEQNGANANTYYCFRMIESDGTLLNQYLQYPQIKTASFTPRTQNWRWLDDEQSTAPTTTLANENSAPVNIANGQAIVLRVTVKDIKNTAADDVRFKLEYSEYSGFSTSTDVVSMANCTATSVWCYANGGGADNGTVASTTLSDVDSCIAGIGNGCGAYTESPTYLTGHRHEANAAAEYSFTIVPAAPRVNRVYYFRLYDQLQNATVTPNTGETYPSLVTEGASLTSTFQGVASSTVTEGVTANITTDFVSVPYGRLVLNTDTIAVQRLYVTTDATEGYRIYLTTSGDLMNSSGDVVTPITGTNAAPTAWNTGCTALATGCFGYHSGDDTLGGGSTRFAANDTYARFSTTTLEEVAYSSVPVTNDSIDMVYRLKARPLQAAGQYNTSIRYIIVPVF